MLVGIFSFIQPGFSWPLYTLATHLQNHSHEIRMIGFRDSEGIGTSGRGSFTVGNWWDLRAIEQQYESALHLINTFKPDVIIAPQLMVGIRAATLHHDVPHVTFGLGALDFSGTTLYACALRVFMSRAHTQQKPFVADLHRLAKSIPSRTGWKELFDTQRLFGKHLLLRSPHPESKPKGDSAESGIIHIGPSLADPYGATDRFLRNTHLPEEPIIGVYWGKTFGYTTLLDNIMQAAGRTDAQLLVDGARLDYTPRLTKGSISTNLPYQALAQLPAVMISNAHTSSCLAAYAYGIPTLFVPTGSGTDELAADYHALLPNSTEVLKPSEPVGIVHSTIQSLLLKVNNPKKARTAGSDWKSTVMTALQ